MTKTLLPYSGYVRISRVGDRSGPSFISEDVQRDTVARLAAFHGIEVDEVVAETDVSGKTPIEERELGRLVAKVEAGDSGGLIVWKVSRFSRNLLDGVTVADRITRAGGRLIADDFDSSNAMGKAILGFLLGWSEEELDSRRAGWREAQRRAASRGAYPSRTPLGYRKDGEGRLVVDPKKADTVTRVFRMRAQGESLGECATVLDAPASSVRALLGNPAYLGRIDHGRGDTAIYVEGTHPALTDERTWHLAQRGDGPPQRTGSLKGKGLLLGLITCAGCGHRLTMTASGPPDARVASYTCRKRRSGSVCTSPASARVDAVDALVLPQLDSRTPQGVGLWDAMGEADALGALHQEATEELDAFLGGALVRELGAELYAREVARRRDVVTERWATFEAAERQGRALLRLGETSGLEHDRARATAALESVTLAKSTRGRWQPLEERLQIVWAEKSGAHA
jgi:site-specific DNA recombinase